MTTERIFADLTSPSPQRRGGGRGWLWGFAAVAAGLVLLLAGVVAHRSGAPLAPDVWLRDAAYAHRAAALTVLAKALAYSGKYYLIVVYGLGLAGYAWLQGDRRLAAGAAAVPLGLAALLEGVKTLIGRPRPDPLMWLMEESGHSFPSGHAAGTMAVCLLAFVLARRYLKPGMGRRAAEGLLLALPFAMGLSRIYLGVHYVSDVTAGWLLGAAWFCACWAWAGGEEKPPWEK